jgi:RNA polymerase sigma-70 factor (ECF subfamily)
MASEAALNYEHALGAVAKGDRAMFEALYRAAGPHLFGLIVRIVGQGAIAEEILQDTFVTIWQHAGSFDATKGSGVTWLRTIARRRALDHKRRLRPMVSIEDEPAAAELVDDTADVFAAIAQGEDGRRLARCLERLAERPRRAIMVAFFDGLSHEDVARRLDAPLGTIKSSIRRGLRQLAECLGHAPPS